MRKIHYAAAAVSLVALIGISPALAQEATDAGCRAIDMQVGTALESSQTGDRDQALRERNSGRQFCNHGFYKIGTEHLANALKLLGASKT
jgi:hypothetical protein